jgi:phospholipase/carboxylesterase
MEKSTQNPHENQPLRMVGEMVSRAQAVMLMVHGRGASAEDILVLTDHLKIPGFTFVAPQAAENTWYPNRFLDPLASNEPWLSSALARLAEVLKETTDSGIPPERTILLGFSQGACLAMEFAARNARRYGGVVGLSGALIGPNDTPRNYAGSLDGTPVFLGCSDVDPHVPKEHVDQAARVLGRLGGKVTERIYPNLDHSVNQDEIEFVLNMMKNLS